MRDPDTITFYNKSSRNLCGPYYRDLEKALTPNTLRIVADENIPALDALFADMGEIKTYPGRHISHADLVEADVLLVRSITQVTSELLANTPVKFVGTATIGTDHIDEAALKALGIGFSSAPGCNADAVVEYVLSCLLHLAAEQSFSLHEKTIGIIGVGQVGRASGASTSCIGSITFTLRSASTKKRRGRGVCIAGCVVSELRYHLLPYAFDANG
ncbi:Erythronate-4-phosphate dehydrogenase [Nitrincola nitratireducens]|uniref:Erythronate-4-phosphate dehydrogenase n=1 Tax=Nitrincola nitratireducens TaxID=1229521 RepID=W9V157_9GAMM|nr:Erythronate-4-phosphate dehydrogenase [Nitrincola nitratireducens]